MYLYWRLRYFFAMWWKLRETHTKAISVAWRLSEYYAAMKSDRIGE